MRSLVLVGAREAAPWIEVFARAGFVAKGVLYMTISALAASAALGMGGKADPDSKHALLKLLEAPFGRVLVALIAIGLVGYGVWRIIEGLADPERHGHDAAGIALRISSIVRGVAHLALAFAAGLLALYRESPEGGGGHVRAWVGKALAVPGGVYVIYGIAAGLAAFGVYQLVCAVRAKLGTELRIGPLSTSMRGAVIAISRFGIAARGVVFGMVALLLYRAARDHDPRQAGGLGDSLRVVLFELGRGPYLAIALGLGAYGIYELINAKYRRIQV